MAAYHCALEIFTKADLPQPWARTQNNLGVALCELGTHSGGEEGRKLLEGKPLPPSIAPWRSLPKADLPTGLGPDPEQSGRSRSTESRERAVAGEEGRKLLEGAVAAYRSALEVFTKADLPQDWATTQNNLGLALYAARDAQRRREEGRKLLEDAVAAYRSALEVFTKGRFASGIGRRPRTI